MSNDPILKSQGMLHEAQNPNGALTINPSPVDYGGLDPAIYNAIQTQYKMDFGKRRTPDGRQMPFTPLPTQSAVDLYGRLQSMAAQNDPVAARHLNQINELARSGSNNKPEFWGRYKEF